MLKKHIGYWGSLCAVALLLPLQGQGTPLHQAIRAQDLSTVREIVEVSIGNALDLTIGDGITPLHLAAATDQPDIVSLLIERGATINTRTTRGFTPLHWAASRNAIDCMALLLAAGADPNAEALRDITPLHWAATKDAMIAVQLLLEAGANPQARTTLEETPLHLAVKNDPNSESAILLAQASLLEPLPDPQAPTPTALQPSGSALPEMTEPTAAALPGMFLTVPVGLGANLTFVWLEQQQLWFGKHEISNAQYRRYQPAHTSRSVEGFSLNENDQPAVFVSWQDAQDFCAWLNTHFADRIPEQYAFRLPTEAEWMFAASMGETRTYPWGEDWPPAYGNFPDETARKALSHWRGIEGYEDGFAVTAPVDSAGMNEFGIFGLAGNVWEWTRDWLDPQQQTFKIRKGGSWDFDQAESLRVRHRGLDRPDAKYATIGFRIVVAPKP